MNELVKVLIDVSKNIEKSNLTKVEDWFSTEGRVVASTKEIPLNNTIFEKSYITDELNNNENIKHKDVSNLSEPVELKPISKETIESLKNEDWDQKIIDNLGSEEEAEIYKGANLKPAEVNGKPALIRGDIDPNLKGPDGKTNLERMSDGNAPYYIDENGKLKSYQLHHIGQKNDGPLAELTQKEHIQDGNDKILHPNQKESEIDRLGFQTERAGHWKNRAEQLKTQGN